MANMLMLDMVDLANQGAAVGKQNRFNRLAGEAYAAPEEQRNALLTQAVGIDPRGGLALQDSIQDRDDGTLRRAVGAARYVKQAYETKNPQMIQGAYQAVRPFLTKLGAAQGKIPPEQWSDDMLPQLHQLLAMGEGAMNKAGLPNEVRTFDYMSSNLSAEEKARARRIELGLDPRAVTGASKPGTIVGEDGKTRPTWNDPTTKETLVYDDSRGQWVPLGVPIGGGAAPQPPQPQARESSGMPVVFDDVPPQVQASITSNPDAWAAAGDGSTARMVPQPGPQRPASAGLGVSRSPEEQAALTTAAQEQAKINAEFGAYDRMTGLEAERAAAVEGAKAAAKTQAEVSAQQGVRTRDAGQVLSLLAEAEKLLPRATGSGGGALLDTIAGASGYATDGAKATAQLRTIAGQLVSKMPRMEGPQSNADVKMYQDMAGDLANPATPREQRLAALQTIRKLSQKYAAAQRSQPPRGPTASAPAAGGVDDLLSKYGIR